MSDTPRTHRDTLAFLLAMAGATTWALFPMVALLHHTNSSPVLAVLLVFGPAIGAFSAAAVWRNVSPTTVGVAAALGAIVTVGTVESFARGEARAFDLANVLAVSATVAAAVVAALLGRRWSRGWPGFVAALIILSSAGIAGLALAWLAMFDASGPIVAAAVLLGCPLVSVILAALLCRDAEPPSIGGWVFFLIASITPSLVFSSETRHVAGVIFFMLVVAVVAGFLTAVVAALVHHLRPRPRPDAAVPPAHVVRP